MVHANRVEMLQDYAFATEIKSGDEISPSMDYFDGLNA